MNNAFEIFLIVVYLILWIVGFINIIKAFVCMYKLSKHVYKTNSSRWRELAPIFNLFGLKYFAYFFNDVDISDAKIAKYKKSIKKSLLFFAICLLLAVTSLFAIDLIGQ